jgi:hypothetical protein
MMGSVNSALITNMVMELFALGAQVLVLIVPIQGYVYFVSMIISCLMAHVLSHVPMASMKILPPINVTNVLQVVRTVHQRLV